MLPLNVFAGSHEDIHRLMFGPYQHDAHVECWKGAKWLAEMTEANARGLAAVNQFVAELQEDSAQRVAADHNYNTATIRAALHRWQSGAFADCRFADIRTARIRQLTRALDIAIERQAMATAAE